MGLIWSVGASFRLIHIVGRIPFLDVAGLGFPENSKGSSHRLSAFLQAGRRGSVLGCSGVL